MELQEEAFYVAFSGYLQNFFVFLSVSGFVLACVHFFKWTHSVSTNN